MKDKAYYLTHPWDREDDESILEIYDAESGARTVAAEFDSLIEAPNWSRDGASLYFNRRGRICRFSLAAGEVTEIDSGFADACNNDHVLSPDGTMLAVSHAAREDHQSRVYTLPIGGGTPRLVTPLGPSYLHGWSPDGSTLAYCAARGGEYDVYTIPAGGGAETRLTDAPGLNDGPEYSPDGRHIWFNSVRSGTMQIWRMNADGTAQTQMTDDETRNHWFPHVSPDGKQVVMLAYRAGDVEPGQHVPHKHVELRLMDADGKNLRTAAAFFGGQGTINVNSWAPDSRRFAFVRYRIRGVGEL